MARSRSGSRPSSRPASRPVSMISTALALSPLTMELGEQLITKITTFIEGEENFDICRDFMVSNLLYHNCLEPHERDLERRFNGIKEKWIINADGGKADQLANLLTRFNNAPVFSEHHEQGDIRVRILSLILHLSNSTTSDNNLEEEIAEDQGLGLLQVDQRQVAKDKAFEIRKLLAEGEENNWRPASESDLSDWSASDNDDDDGQHQGNSEHHSDKHFRPTYLPGCKTPLQPPVPVSSLPGKYINTDMYRAKNWLDRNIMSTYWVKERDGRNKFPLRINSCNESADLIWKLENFRHQQGIPVDDIVKVSEYQILRECLWTLRNSLCKKSPLFNFDDEQEAFVANRDICIPSLTLESLSNLLAAISDALTCLHRLTSFVARVFDRRCDDSVSNIRNDDKSALPPFTYEAYAEALAQLLDLFSADLLQIENTVQQGTITFTLMDLARDLAPWFQLVNRLATFHKTFVDDQSKLPFNWQKSMILLSSLSASLSTEYKPQEFSIFVDLFLKAIAPYFRIASVWMTQGRLEDWRNEFVFAVNPKFCGKRVKRKHDEEESTLEESFWTQGFVTHPYEETLAKLHLEVPEIFIRTLPRILTCGKSIEILTRLQKEGLLPPSEVKIQELAPTTQFYDDFLANLKDSLSQSNVENNNILSEDLNLSDQKNAESLQGQLLSQFINNVTDLDSHLVAAFETMLQQDVVADTEQDDVLNCGQNFLILSGLILDPMCPFSNKVEGSLAPVVHCHTDRACRRLVHLFRETLEMEQHLATVRRVYLLEAGDLIMEFYTELFSRFESFEMSRDAGSIPLSELRSEYHLDPLTLTLFLHDCLGRRSDNSGAIYRFKVDLNSEMLDKQQRPDKKLSDLIDCLSVKYSVDWPLCIILHTKALEKYNQIFVFLLKVKHALWNLQRIQAKDLIEAAEKVRTEDSDESENDKIENDFEEDLSDETKIHRILLLRSWLWHFVGTLHSYFMTRVVHSTELELQADLADCTDLDEIINAHDRYVERIYDRCFLHPTAYILKNAVLRVLNICSDLHRQCGQFVEDRLATADIESEVAAVHQKCKHKSKKDDVLIRSSKLASLEENYAQSHTFLASTLADMTTKRNVPHLEGLAASLIHSCPSVAII